MLPLNYQELATYADRVAPMHPELRNLFFRTMEETDNAVLYDAHMKRTADYERKLEETENRPGKKPRAKRKG